MNPSYYSIAFFLSLATAANADCTNNNPALTAKSFFVDHYDFDYKDPAKIKNVVTTRFYVILEKEWHCKQSELCALESVPWTGAQDGWVYEPIKYTTTSNTGKNATVEMTYQFGTEEVHNEKRTVVLNFEHNSKGACWLLSDLIPPNEGSLVEFIEQWHKKFNNRP